MFLREAGPSNNVLNSFAALTQTLRSCAALRLVSTALSLLETSTWIESGK